jgi:hypothetical protein|nr:MAG TPA: hypothetical protein [Bacteriophage sp.]
MNDAGKVAFTPKGAYNNTVTYEYLDTVVYDGNSYAALKTTTGNTPTDDSEYWKLLVRGGSSVPIATEDINGVVKASEDIGVDSNAKMVLKTDYTEQTELTEIESGETRKTFFGKIAKAISTLVNHININATSAKAGHVKLSNSSAVTDSTGLALPVTEKNASISGTLAYMLNNFSTKIDLLWSNNGSNFVKPDNALTRQSLVSVRNFDNELYDAFIIMYGQGQLVGIRNYDGALCYLTQFLNLTTPENNVYIAFREVKVERTVEDIGNRKLYVSSIYVYGCQHRSVVSGGSLAINNNNSIPYKIYGIRK